MRQVILNYLPGYMFDGKRLVSTGAAIPPTQHVDRKNGEVMYYVRPLFTEGSTIGMFIKHSGIVKSIRNMKGEKP